MKYSATFALLGLVSANEIARTEEDVDYLLYKLDNELTNLLEAQNSYNPVPSFSEFDGYHYHDWEVLPQDLPTGDYSKYVTPSFIKKSGKDLHEGTPAGYRHLFVDELLHNQNNLKGKVQSYIGAWDIISVINGYTDGSGYGGKVRKDGGARKIGSVLLVNEDYPVWTETGLMGPNLLETESSIKYDGYHYNNWDVLAQDVPTGEYETYFTPSFIKKSGKDLHEGTPAGYRHLFVDELLHNQNNLRGKVQSYIGSWDIIAVINGYTDGSGYGGKVTKDGGARKIGSVLLVSEKYPVYLPN